MTAEVFYAEIRTAIAKLDAAVATGDRAAALSALHALAPGASDFTFALATGGPMPSTTASPVKDLGETRSELVEAASWAESLADGRFGHEKAAGLVDEFAAAVRIDAAFDPSVTLRISSADRIREEVRRAAATSGWSAEQVERYVSLRIEEEAAASAAALTENYAEALRTDLAEFHQTKEAS